jgi:nucleotide-binding universal stress UspA family protein
MPVGEPRLRRLQAAEQRIERRVLLQLAQVPGIRARYVHRDVTGGGIDPVETEQVVVGSPVDRRIEVLADVDAEDTTLAREARRGDVVQQPVDAIVVETHAIDDRLPLGNPEHPRPRTSRLRPRGDGTDFDEAEAQRRQRIDVLAILVEPGGQANGIGKAESHHRHGIRWHRIRQQAARAGCPQQVDARHADAVCDFRIEREKEVAEKRIEHERDSTASQHPALRGARRLEPDRYGRSNCSGGSPGRAPTSQAAATATASCRRRLERAYSKRRKPMVRADLPWRQCRWSASPGAPSVRKLRTNACHLYCALASAFTSCFSGGPM